MNYVPGMEDKQKERYHVNTEQLWHVCDEKMERMNKPM